MMIKSIVKRMLSIFVAILVCFVIYFGLGHPINNESKAINTAEKYVKFLYPWLYKSLDKHSIVVYDDGQRWVIAWVLYDDTGYSVEGGGGPCITLSKNSGVLEQFSLME